MERDLSKELTGSAGSAGSAGSTGSAGSAGSAEGMMAAEVLALGPEASLPLERNHPLYGFVEINYQWESDARVTTQGSEATVLATFLLKPIKLPGT